MTAQSNDRDPGAPGHRRDIYSDLRRHNERRVDVARMMEARRIRQVERAMQTARNARPHEPRK